ncbi:unnamed protein product [Meloidogyne enterolobii]|uniref:Uncharacterized protein n=1 Tax=Meloidogyne enterolobii TaxID=390850 RepID=A0ACB1AMU5_MELEN
MQINFRSILKFIFVDFLTLEFFFIFLLKILIIRNLEKKFFLFFGVSYSSPKNTSKMDKRQKSSFLNGNFFLFINSGLDFFVEEWEASIQKNFFLSNFFNLRIP